jgi:hypothetical protein
MGKEFGQKQGAQSQGQAVARNSSDGKGSDKAADRSNSKKNGGGLGNAGIGQGGHVGPQQPLPGVKKDELVRGTVNEKGDKLTKSYKGLPDATKDKAAYYQVMSDNKKAAEASLNKEEIPAGYKEQVKQYFNSIQPH